MTQESLYEKLLSEISKYNKDSDTELIRTAYEFAKKYHLGQKRSSGENYITHPLSVAINLTRINADDTSIISGLLHDVIEDTDCTTEDVEKEFGKNVARIVDGVTKLGKVYYKNNMEEREIESLRKMFIGVSEDIRVILVKICDRIHNIETLEYRTKEERVRKAKETLEIYVPIIHLLSLGEFIGEVEDLCFRYINEEEYKEMYENFGKKYNYYKTKIDNIKYKLTESFKSIGYEYSVSGRLKSFYSIYRKMKNKSVPLDMIYDVVAFRILTKTVKGCYTALRIIHSLYKVKEDRFKDYISSPKNNGYQAIHTTVFDKDGDMVEFQILTNEMSELNKYGLAAHYLYKNYKTDFINIPDWVKNILDIQKGNNDSEYFYDKLKIEILSPRIQCYTPKGMQIDLPKDSTILDFAYRIHSDLGNYFECAYINGILIRDPIHILHRGDIVNIVKGEEINKNFMVEFISIVKTVRAREYLQKYFRKESKDKRIKLGRYMINKRLEILGYRYFEDLPYKTQNNILQKFELNDIYDFYDDIGSGNIDIDRVTKNILKVYNQKDAYKIAELRIKLKIYNYKSITDIVNVFFNLNIKITSFVYNEKSLKVKLTVNNYLNFQNLFLELKRVPNVLSVERLFPFRVMFLHGLIFVSMIFVVMNPFLLVYLNGLFGGKNSIISNLPYVFTFIALILVIITFKKVTKITLPDLLNQKIFWGFMLFLNTLVILTIIAEYIYIKEHYNLIFFLLIAFSMYCWLLFEYINNKIENSFSLKSI